MTLPSRIGERYQVLAQLGRGGSSHVYHVRDVSSGRELALKRVRHDLPPGRARELTKHLEREFYALAQLRHPRVIEVHDYGVSEGLAYYTMELLDAGDLRAAAPLPWRSACELIYDVASSLALLHSRRFVHRDVTPGNIRCTREGRAKLIDFGAMVPMGAGADVIGTPAYVAPEVQQRGVLDAATDLFSLGATLYFLLTGRPPFPAADLAGMPAAWAVPPRAPSEREPQIPAALDGLVLGLLSIDPAARPRTAFEVMQRLAAIAELPVSESVNVSQGYLSAPQVFGRDVAVRAVRSRLRHALSGRGAAIWLEGDAGVGRTRALELCTLEAKTAGASVLRLDASQGAAPLSAAARLSQALLAALPEVASAALPDSPELRVLLSGSQPSGTRAALDALTRWLLDVTRASAVVIAIDDVHRVDEASVAWLATLAHAASQARLLVIATADTDAVREANAARDVLKRHSSVVPVLPLTRAESDAMFASVFGAVPNLALVSERIFAFALGNPRRSLALAQYLLDQGRIAYAAGAWSLPEELAPEALAVGFEALFTARIARLGSLARKLAETQALSLVAALRREDYHVLAPDVDARGVDDALSQLIAHEIVRSDGTHYLLAHSAYASALLAPLDAELLAQRHDALARLAQHCERHPYVLAYHRLHAGQSAAALDVLLASQQSDLATLQALDPTRMSSMLEQALDATVALARPQRERFELMQRLVQLGLLGEDRAYLQVGPLLRARLEQDAGLTEYWEHAEISDPNERLRVALTQTVTRYANTPEHERVYSVEDALRQLAFYVLMSIAISTRRQDLALLQGLPQLLEPFAALSPLLRAVWENAEATCESLYRARPERAIERWQRAYELLEPKPGTLRLDGVRPAITNALGEQLAIVGQCAAALEWFQRADGGPLQRSIGARLRGVICLQHGDSEGAVRAWEQDELQSVQISGRQTLARSRRGELQAHWLARDLTGVKQVLEGLRDRVGHHPQCRLAEGYFDALRGDTAGALRAFDDCVAECEPDPTGLARNLWVWVAASAAALSCLLELGRTREARERGEHVLSLCQAHEIGLLAQPIECELALAEAMSGDGPRAIQRIERVIADQLQRGVSGLQLTATYEARARIAMSLRREADVMRYAALAAREYRHGASRSLGSRYGRLLQEARNSGVPLPPEASALAAALSPPVRDAEHAALARSLEDTQTAERPRRVLELLCERAQAQGGFLFIARGPAAELEQVAASVESAASAMLRRFATGYWQQQLEDAELSAVLTELPWSRETHRPGNWQDPQGQCYEAVVLYDAHALPAHVGLALLHVGDRPRTKPDWPTALLSTLAAGMRLCGDA